MSATPSVVTKDAVTERLQSLTDEQRQALNELLQSDQVWRPLPGPQTMAYESTASVLGYGGAAGSGKSSLAVGKALTMHRRVLMMRREAPQAVGLVDEMEHLLGTRDGFSGQTNIWRVSPARHPRIKRALQVVFGSTPHAGNESRYQGRARDFLVLDEATEFLESQVRFLMGWVRTTDPMIPQQTLMTFNPPTTQEGRWILDYFAPWIGENHANPAGPGELRYFAVRDGKDFEVPEDELDEQVNQWGITVHFVKDQTDDQGEPLLAQSRTFIPGRVTDNPYLMGTGYVTQLQALPEPLRSQMLYGDFKAGIGEDPWQVCPSAWVDAAMKRWTDKSPKGEMLTQGVDVARGGKDETVIMNRHEGYYFDQPIAIPGKETPSGQHVVGHVIANQKNLAVVNIDVIGVGASPYDLLRESSHQVIGVNSAEATKEQDKTGRLKMANMRSWLWWNMRELLDPEADNGIALPPNDKLRADLCAPRWKLKGGKVYIESRDELIDRLGRSADYGSACVMAALHSPKRSRASRQVSSQGHNPYRDL